MSSNRTTAFLNVLREQQLLEPAQTEELAQSPSAKADDLNTLAKLILQKRWLSRFQLTEVSQGRVKQLQLGPYRLIDRLGEGGMGMVYKAHHQPMNRTVALKVIRKEKLANDKAVQRFFREVQAAAQLVHANIVVAFDAGQANGTHYFAMEYVDGIDLAKLVKQRGPLPLAIACDYIRQAALGLQHAHERGMVHRDIKPHNLLATQTGEGATKPGGTAGSTSNSKAVVKILDMGLARLSTTPTGDHALTQDGSVIGTPEYVAPEQALDAKAADIRADLYSLGCTFFFLLAGRPPFQGGTLTELLLKHQMEPPPEIRSLRPEVPEDVAAIVGRLLAKKPEERFQTPLELAQALEPICQGGTNPYVLPQRRAGEFETDWSALSSDGPISATRLDKTVESPASGRHLAKGAKKPDKKGATPRALNAPALVAGAILAVALLAGAVYLAWPKKEKPTEPITQGPPPPTSEAGVLAEPEFRLLPLGSLNLQGGQSRELEIRVERKAAHGKKIDVRLDGLPPGVNSDFATIDAYKDSAKIKITVAADIGDLQRDVQVVATSGAKEVKGDFKLNVQRGGVAVGPPPPLPADKEQKRITTGAYLPRAAWFLPPDGNQILAIGSDNRLRVLALDSGNEVRSLPSNSGGVKTWALTPDGRQLFIAHTDNFGRLWNVQDGVEVRAVQHPGSVDTVAVSSDGKIGLTAGGRMVTSNNETNFMDCAVRLWDLQTGKEIGKLDRPNEVVRRAALSPDGRRAVTFASRAPVPGVSSTGVVTLWNVETGKELAEGKIDNGAFLCLEFAPDGRSIFAGSTDRRVRILDVTNLQIVRDLTGPETPITCLAVSADGKYVLAGSGALRGRPNLPPETYDAVIRMWEVETGRELKRFSGHDMPVGWVAFAPDGRRALSASGDKTMRVWDLTAEPAVAVAPPSGAGELKVIPITNGSYIAWFLPPDGRRVLVQHLDNTWRLWDVVDGREVRQVPLPASGNFFTRALSADGKQLFFVIATNGNTLQLLDWETGKQLQQIQHPFKVEAVALSPDGKLGMTASGRSTTKDGQTTYEECAVRVWNLQTGQEMARLDQPNTVVRRVALSPDGRHAATCSGRGNLVVWDLTTSTVVARQVVTTTNSTASRMMFSPDGKRIIASGYDGRVRVLETKSLQLIREFMAQDGPVDAMALSPDGKYVLTSCTTMRGVAGGGPPVPSDPTVRLWELESGSELKRFTGHTKQVHAVAIGPDGTRGLSIGADFTIRIWDLGLSPAVAVKPPELGPMPMPPDKRTAVPAEDKQADALKLIKSISPFKEDYAKTRPSDKAALAVKLLDKAGATTDDPITRYVLLREAADLAAVGSDVATAVAALSAMGQDYAVATIDLKVKALTTAAKLALTPPVNKSLTEAALAAAEEAADVDNYDAALQLTDLAVAASKKAANIALASKVDARAKDLREAQKEFAAAQTAAQTLRDKPGDADASLALGRYLCLRKGDWDKGLSFLAAGSDTALQAAAKKDLTKPAAAPAQKEAGDGWWDLADKQPEAIKLALQQRAGSWYEQAVAGLSGVSHDVVEGRLKQIADLEASSRPPETQAKLTQLLGHTDKVYCLAISPDGKQALTGSADRTVKLWDLPAAKLNKSIDNQTGDVRGVAWSNDGKVGALASADGHVRLIENGRTGRGITYGGTLTSLCVALFDDRRVFMGDNRGQVHIWKLDITVPGSTFIVGAMIAVNSIVVSTDGRYGLSGCDDGTARSWDLDTGRETGRLLGHAGPVLGVALSKDAKVALTGSADKTVRVWNTAVGTTTKLLKGHQGKVTCVALSPDGQLALSGSEDRTVRLWDVRSGKTLRQFTGHGDAVTAVGLSPDGRYVLTGCADKIVRLWDLKPGK